MNKMLVELTAVTGIEIAGRPKKFPAIIYRIILAANAAQQYELSEVRERQSQ